MAIFWLSFVESFSTILLQRGVYFYTTERLGFDATANLWLALGFGVLYAAGATSSQRWTRAHREKPVLASAIAILLVLHAAGAASPNVAVLSVSFLAIGFVQGLKWPIVESYVGAGKSPEQMPSALSRFNLSWALAVPPAVALAGALADGGWPRALFVCAALCNLIALGLLRPLPVHPAHNPEPQATLQEPTAGLDLSLLASARVGLLSSYTLLFLLAPLLPALLGRHGLEGTQAGAAAALLDAVRVITFAVVGVWTAWRGRSAPILAMLLALPIAAGSILFGSQLWIVLLGEVAFGVSTGFIYSAALYYALVAERAQVSAGGAHESLIGLGLAIGPALGLIAQSLALLIGQPSLALALCVAPLSLLSIAAGFCGGRRSRRDRQRTSTE